MILCYSNSSKQKNQIIDETLEKIELYALINDSIVYLGNIEGLTF